MDFSSKRRVELRSFNIVSTDATIWLGAPLLEQHLEFLRKKLNLGAGDDVCNDNMIVYILVFLGDSITWDTFVKNNIHDRMFSFWGWL